MGLFLEEYKQKRETQGAQEERTLLFGDEMDMQLDDGNRNGRGRQEDFDGHAFEAERRQQESDPVTCAGDGETEDENGRQEDEEAFPSPKQTGSGGCEQNTCHDANGMDVLLETNKIHYNTSA